MTKQKSSKANLQVHYLMLKMLQRAMYLDFPDLGQVTKFNPKMQDFKRVQKIAQWLGAKPPCPLCDMFELH